MFANIAFDIMDWITSSGVRMMMAVTIFILLLFAGLELSYSVGTPVPVVTITDGSHIAVHQVDPDVIVYQTSYSQISLENRDSNEPEIFFQSEGRMSSFVIYNIDTAKKTWGLYYTSRDHIQVCKWDTFTGCKLQIHEFAFGQPALIKVNNINLLVTYTEEGGPKISAPWRE